MGYSSKMHRTEMLNSILKVCELTQKSIRNNSVINRSWCR